MSESSGLKKFAGLLGIAALAITGVGIGVLMVQGATFGTAIAGGIAVGGFTASFATLTAIGFTGLTIASIPSPPINETGAGDRGTPFVDPNAVAVFAFGTTILPSNLVYEESYRPPGYNLHHLADIFAHAWHPIEGYTSFTIGTVNGPVAVTFNGSGVPTNPASWANFLSWVTKDGTQTTAFTHLSGSGWPSTAVGAGVAHSVLVHAYEEQFYQDTFGGTPNQIEIVAECALLYDPRLDNAYGTGSQDFADPDTWTFNNGNAALVLLRALIGEYTGGGDLVWGRGAAENEIDMDTFVAMANVADETLDSKPRFRIGGVHQWDGNWQAFVQRWEQETGGKLSRAGGKYRVWLPHDDLTPVTTITESMLLDSVALEHPMGSLELLFNTARGRYIEPTEGYVAFPYPEIEEAAAITADGEKRVLYQDFSWVQDVSIAERIARIKVRRSRFQRTWIIGLPWIGHGPSYQVFTVHNLNCKETNDTNQLVRVIDRQILFDGSTILILQEENAAIYDDTIALGTPNVSNPLPNYTHAVTPLYLSTGAGPSQWVPVLSNITRNGSTFTKTGGTDNVWDASFRSAEGHTACAVFWRFAQTNLACGVGLTTDPAADDNYTSIDFWLHCTDAGALQVYRNGVFYASYGSVLTTDQFAIQYNGLVVRFQKNGATFLTLSLVGATLYVDSSFYDMGAAVNSVTFWQLSPVIDRTSRNMLVVEAWTASTSFSSVGNFTSVQSVAGESQIINAVGPFGTTELIWECRCSDPGNGTGGEANGGWANTGDCVGLDSSKSYRLVVWAKRTANANTDNTFYLGCGTTGNTYDLGGSSNGNPYFVATGLGNALPVFDKWYLVVGIVHGDDYAGGSTGQTGVYDPETGRRVFDGTEYRMAPGATTQEHRSFMYYGGNTDVRLYLTKPRFEAIDGNEPPISALLTAGQALDWRNDFVYDEFAYLNAVDLHSHWIKHQGGIADADITLLTGLTDAPGGNAVRFGNNSGNDEWWGAFKDYLMPFVPNGLYEVGIVARTVAGSGQLICGVEGLANNRTTLINTAGLNTYSSQHYVAASGETLGSTWETWRGYIKGHSATAGAQANDPSNPSAMYTGTAFIRPMMLVNYNGAAGQTDVAALWLRRIGGALSGRDTVGTPEIDLEAVDEIEQVEDDGPDSVSRSTIGKSASTVPGPTMTADETTDVFEVSVSGRGVLDLGGATGRGELYAYYRESPSGTILTVSNLMTFNEDDVEQFFGLTGTITGLTPDDYIFGLAIFAANDDAGGTVVMSVEEVTIAVAKIKR